MFGVRLMPEQESLTALNRLTVQTEEASALLVRALDGKGNGSKDYLVQIRPISAECNAIAQRVSERLKHSFMDALDREDIYSLVMSLTGIVHRLDEFGSLFSSYQSAHCTPEMTRMVGLIRNIVWELGQALPAIDRPDEIQHRLQSISKCQREGGEAYREAVGALLRSGRPPTDLLMYKDLYKRLESIIGDCEQVGSLVERISIKHA